MARQCSEGFLRMVRRGGVPVIAAAIAVLPVAAGCGGNGDRGSGGDVAAMAAPPADAFPDPNNRALEEMVGEMNMTNAMVASPAGHVFTVGRNRLSFGLYTAGREEITDAAIALYVAPSGGDRALGPFPARIESLRTDPAFRSRSTASDPDAAHVVYVAEVRLPRRGDWDVVAVTGEGGDGHTAMRMPSLRVEPHPKIPAPGEPVPAMHTPTVEDVADVGAIDTREPPSTMHEVDLAEVLGRAPVVLLFATPALCQSRVCAPVVDITEQVKAEHSGDGRFIFMEIYDENDPNQGLRPQVERFGLPTEPWLFVIDERGRVSTRIEGAFSAQELEAALAEVD